MKTQIVSALFAALVLTGTKSQACSFTPTGASAMSLTSVVNEVAKTEYKTLIAGVSLVSRSAGNSFYEVTLVDDQSGSQTKVQYQVRWIEKPAQPGFPSCPQPVATKL